MDKTLQDLAWSVLPKEFKEEVKRMWSVEVDCTTKYKSELHKHRTGLLYELFGEHLHWQNNLTSDAEGEEMLACEKSRVQQQYKRATQLKDDSGPKCALVGDQMERVLLGLFGSKCLPDAHEENFTSKEPKKCDNPLADKEGCRWRNAGKCAFDSACYFEPLTPQEPKPKSVSEISKEISDRVAETIKAEFDKIATKLS